MTSRLREPPHQLSGLSTDAVTALADLRGGYGEMLWIAELDVTDTAAVREVVDREFADLGQIDVIVNNAGYGLFDAAEELNDQQIRDQIDTNLVGPIQVVRAALPHLRGQGGGRIVQLGEPLAAYDGTPATMVAAGSQAASGPWARLVSNQRPLACED